MSSENLKLFPYQITASAFIQKTLKSILRLDTGLGKTAVCIDAVKSLEDVKNILCIVPAFLVENWNREVKMWGCQKNWNIVSYNFATSRDLNISEYDIVICDEAHYLKNWSAKRTKKIILEYLFKCKRVVLATATPYVRSAADLHPLFSVCGNFGKFSLFQEKYCNKKPNPFVRKFLKWDYYGFRKDTVSELKEKSKPFMLSVKKSDVLKDLPDKICTDIFVEVSKERHLKNLDTEAYFDIETGKMKGGLYSILSSESVELGLEKSKHVIDWLEGVSDSVVVFCKHKKVVDRIVESLKDVKFGVITGDTNNEKRTETIDKFQNGELKIIIATMGACGVGVTLTRASIACFVELPWSYAELKQCEDRLHRIGQKNCVNIYRFIAPESIDEMITSTLNSKEAGENISVGGM